MHVNVESSGCAGAHPQLHVDPSLNTTNNDKQLLLYYLLRFGLLTIRRSNFWRCRRPTIYFVNKQVRFKEVLFYGFFFSFCFIFSISIFLGYIYFFCVRLDTRN